MQDIKIRDYQKPLNIPEAEHAVLEYWDQSHAFEESVSERPADKRYVFYDGPPFATGLPHYGHILVSTIKDMIPRYWTMKGYRVERVWGWDCHGIPIENMIEKELDLKGGKKGIEALGIDKFNAACRAAILRFDKEWEKVIRRIGRWVDFKHSYKTMDLSYMESVWWAFKQLFDKGHVYEGKKVILYCPRCATPLSNFEIAMDNSYKDVEDNSVYIKFKVHGSTNEYLVAWTTTPWTLIGNVALAVDPKASYVLVQSGADFLWLAESLVAAVMAGQTYTVVSTLIGEQLVGKSYEPLYAYMPLDGKKAHYVTAADFVSLADGTGIVHTAAIFGEDDYLLAVAMDLPRVPTLDDQGKFFDFVTPLSGVFYKKAEAWVIEDLSARGLMLKAEKIVHSYPFCYRCETALYYNAIPAWFIDVQKMKNDLVNNNEPIHWYPDHLKYGRFGKGLAGAPDWNISRSRYWGTPMPIWQYTMPNGQCKMRIIGSLAELKKWAVDPKEVERLTDIHREFLDGIDVWVDDKRTMKGKRISEVFDCWVESGSMPYASIHYPFENEKVFESTHPAQFISEYIAQTRAWFYTLHVMSVGLFGKHTFENALTTGTVLAADGTKMSKSKKNYPDPAVLFEQYGVDALRFYLMGSVVMRGENLNFSEMQVKEVYQKLISTIWNVFSFYKLYAKDAIPPEAVPVSGNILDRWVVSRMQSLIRDVTQAMDTYDTVKTCRLIQECVTDVSSWYLRRSRDRLKKDKIAVFVFGWVLVQIAKIMAPVTPFIAEMMYQNIHGGRSIHLEYWPTVQSDLIDPKLEDAMVVARTVVEGLHALRKTHKVPVKQAVSSWSFDAQGKNPWELFPEIVDIIQDEVNIHQLIPPAKQQETAKMAAVNSPIAGEIALWLDLVITPELTQERIARELARQIQVLRKEKKCTIDAEIAITLPHEYQTLPESLLTNIQKETLVNRIVWGQAIDILTG